MSAPGQTRRLFLKASALSLAGLSLVGCEPSGQIDLDLAGEPFFSFFTPADAAILLSVAEAMIPTTDTVGARETHAVLYLDQLMLTWASAASQTAIVLAVRRFDELALAQAGAPYLDLAEDARIALVSELDAASFGAERDTDPAAAYRLLKRLIFHIHYSSEAANPDFVLIPGQYRGDLSEQEYTALVEENRY
ncbi:MAG: gluconate 2-dehydrogenase subunit 3 family protein [Pseudomonadota bacterium]